MKTVIDIDEELIKKAMALAGTKTKKETVRIALEELIKAKQRQRLKEMAGSGIVDISLQELKAIRKKRQKRHQGLPG